MREERGSTTAEIVCSWRALEACLPPERRLLDDPYAAGFLRGLRAGWLGALRRLPSGLRLGAARAIDVSLSGTYSFVIARHRQIDERLRAFSGEQVVLLGAGYDSRRARLREHLVGKRVFEVDHPATARAKAERAASAFGGARLAPAQEVQVDFVRESFADALLAHGFEQGAPTAWVWEGVSMYLPEAGVLECLQRIAGLSGPGSWVSFDALTNPGGLEGASLRALSAALRVVGEPFLWTPSPLDLARVVSRSGLDVAEVCPTVDLVRRFDPRRVSRGLLESSLVLVHATSREG